MIGKKIIVEGVDGAGKSTYIQNFIANSDERWDIIHCTRHTPNNYSYFMDILNSSHNVIFDRSMWGQFVYNTVEDRKNNNWLDIKELKKLCEWINKSNIKIVYVYADPEVCLYNCKKDSEDCYYTLDYIKELDSRFRHLFSLFDISVEYFYNDWHPDEIPTVGMSSDDRNKVIGEFNYKSLPSIIAVDYDGTIAKNGFPDISKAEPNIKLIEYLKQIREQGSRLILWTCRTDQYLIDACNWCADHKLYFDAVNENISEVKGSLDGGPRKVYADVYIDDKNNTLKDLGMEF